MTSASDTMRVNTKVLLGIHVPLILLALAYIAHHDQRARSLYAPEDAVASSDYAASMAHRRSSELGSAGLVVLGWSLAATLGLIWLPRPMQIVLANLYVLSLALLVSEIGLQLVMHVPALSRPGGVHDRGLWSFDRGLGWFHEPYATASLPRTDGSGVPARLNSIGLRSPELESDKGARTRILVFGDSFVFGVGVEQSLLMTARLQEILAPRFPEGLDVVNLGVSGYSTDQELLLFERLAARLQPDIVVLVVCANDFLANAQDFVYQQYNKPYFLVTEEGEMTLQNTPVPRLTFGQNLKLFMGRESNLWNLVRTMKVSHPTAQRFRGWFDVGRSRVPRRPHKTTRALVTRFDDRTRSLGARLLVTSTGALEPGPFALLSRHLREQSIPHFDMEPVLRDAQERSPDRQWIQQDGGRHWDRDGHALVASELARYLDSYSFWRSPP